MLSGKKILSAVLSAALLLPAASALAEDDAFAAEIERRYTAPSIDNRSEVRWWMAEAGHTDETIRAEIQAMYDGGFRGVSCARRAKTKSAKRTTATALRSGITT